MGRGFVLRPVRPHDVGAIAAFFENLSAASRRRRFHGAVARLPAALLHRFTHPDPGVEQAWLAFAVDPGDGAERCIGEARYAPVDDATPPADDREFALAVADGWQGLGIGAALLSALVVRARWHGVAHLHGDVQRDNLPMIGLAQAQGFTLRSHPSDARLLRLSKPLEAPALWEPWFQLKSRGTGSTRTGSATPRQ